MSSTNERITSNNNNNIPNKQQGTDDVKDFLVIKSTAQQLREGVERPVDTAFIEDDGSGKLFLKAVFDVKLFKPNEIDIKIKGQKLELIAQCLDDREEALYRKTMSRTIDLPENVDPKAMQCEISADKLLTVSMPFQVSPSPNQPRGPSTVPIISENGKRLIRLQLMIGPDFSMDDVKVSTSGRSLFIKASYEAEVGARGLQVTRRELSKEFKLPEYIEIDDVTYLLTNQGVLLIEILLKDLGGKGYKFSVTTEEVTARKQDV